MRAVEEYKKYAKGCRELAKRIPFPEDRKTLEEIAEAWETVARLRQRSMVEESDEPFPAILVR